MRRLMVAAALGGVALLGCRGGNEAGGGPGDEDRMVDEEQAVDTPAENNDSAMTDDSASQPGTGGAGSTENTYGSGLRNDGATRSDATSPSGSGGSGLTGMGSTEQMDSNSAQNQAQPKQRPADEAERR